MTIFAVISFCSFISNQELYGLPYILISLFCNGSLKFEITAKRLYAASQRVL